MLVQLLCLEVSLSKKIIQKVWDYSFSGKIHAGFKVAAIALFSLLNYVENSGTLKTSSRSTCLHLAPYLQLKARGLWKCHSSTSSLSSTPASHLDVPGPGSDRINGLFHLLINGICWSYNPLRGHPSREKIRTVTTPSRFSPPPSSSSFFTGKMIPRVPLTTNDPNHGESRGSVKQSPGHLGGEFTPDVFWTIISGDSWMYPYQRTPMGNPYIMKWFVKRCCFCSFWGHLLRFCFAIFHSIVPSADIQRSGLLESRALKFGMFLWGVPAGPRGPAGCLDWWETFLPNSVPMVLIYNSFQHVERMFMNKNYSNLRLRAKGLRPCTGYI